jgi:hypothetical protein
MRCSSCTADLVHCHGTLVQHADGTIECTDDTCPGTDLVFHELRIVCDLSEQGCHCLLALSA